MLSRLQSHVFVLKSKAGPLAHLSTEYQTIEPLTRWALPQPHGTVVSKPRSPRLCSSLTAQRPSLFSLLVFGTTSLSHILGLSPAHPHLTSHIQLRATFSQRTSDNMSFCSCCHSPNSAIIFSSLWGLIAVLLVSRHLGAL